MRYCHTMDSIWTNFIESQRIPKLELPPLMFGIYVDSFKKLMEIKKILMQKYLKSMNGFFIIYISMNC